MNKLNTFLFVCLSAIVVSCDSIKDSLKDCVYDTNIAIKFDYYGDESQGNNVLEKYIFSSELYIYDSNGKLFLHHSVAQDDLLSRHVVKLPSGSYTLVNVGNVGNKSKVTGVKFMTSGKISPKGYLDNTLIDTNDKLYFSSQEINVPKGGKLNETSKNVTVEFKAATIQLYVISKGFGNRNMGVAVDHLVPQIDFNLHDAASADATYYLPLSRNLEQDVIVNTGHTFRFKNQNDINVTLFEKIGDTSHSIEKVSLASMIAQEGLNVENKQELILVIEFEQTTKGISVSIKEWKEIIVVPGN